MKQIIIALGLLWSVNAMATDVMVCKQGGYAANAEDFHNIKVEGIVETRFEITPERIINTNVGIVFDIVDPSTVGFEDLDIKAYMNRYRNEVLYLYKNDSGQLEIGVSALIDDSDAMYADKTLYTSCSFEQQGGSQRAVASKSSLSLAQGGVDHTLPVYRF